MHFPTIKTAFGLAACATMALTSLPTAFGHGYIISPAAVWQTGSPEARFSATIDEKVFGKFSGARYGSVEDAESKFFWGIRYFELKRIKCN